jgi:hypothetical protein
MSKARFKDFDAFFAEHEKETDVVKLFGKDYIIPIDMPASVMLKYFRNKNDAELTDSEQIELAINMLGKDNVEEWCEKGLTMNQLAEIMKWSAARSAGTSKKKEMKTVKKK